MNKYPHEFLGRCPTCLDNAYLSSERCLTGYGNGQPLNDGECAVNSAQNYYDRERALVAKKGNAMSHPADDIKLELHQFLTENVTDLEDVDALMDDLNTIMIPMNDDVGNVAGEFVRRLQKWLAST